MRKSDALVFAILLLFFVGFSLSRPNLINLKTQSEFLGFETVNSDTTGYIDRIQLKEPLPEDLKTPVQWLITKFILQFTDILTVMWLFPFLTFFSALYLTLKLFEHLNLNPFLILLGLSWKVEWVVHFFNYDADNWMLLLFSILTYAIIMVEEKDNWKFVPAAIAISIVAVFTKAAGIFLPVFLFIFLIYKFWHQLTDRLFALLPKGLLASTMIGEWFASTRNSAIVKADSLFAFFTSPIQIVTVFAGFKYIQNKFYLIFLGFTIFLSHVAYNYQHSLGTIYKYTFFLTPFSLVMLGMIYKEIGGKNGISKEQFALIVLVTAFFYLDNFGRFVNQIGLSVG